MAIQVLKPKDGFRVADEVRAIIYKNLDGLDLEDPKNLKGCLELCRGLMRILGDLKAAANLSIVTLCRDTELSIEPKE